MRISTGQALAGQVETETEYAFAEQAIDEYIFAPNVSIVTEETQGGFDSDSAQAQREAPEIVTELP